MEKLIIEITGKSGARDKLLKLMLRINFNDPGAEDKLFKLVLGTNW